MRRVSKFALAGLVAMGIAALSATGTAQGYGGKGVGPGKACPNDGEVWFLTGPSPGDTVVDRNGDGLICVRAVQGRGSSRDVPGFTVRDDLYFVVF